jgi:hypothetical protein
VHDQTAQVDDLRLVATPSALNCADLFVKFTLIEWQVPTMVAVVTSVDEKADLSMITLRLRLRGGVLAVEIEDFRRTAPTVVLPRALRRVKSGVEPLAGGRQLLWAELPLPTGMDATVVPLPRRGTTKAAAVAADEAEEEDVDVETMQRILNSLRRDPFNPPPEA